MNRSFYVLFSLWFCTFCVAATEETEPRAKHWAWQSVAKPTPPEVPDQQWSKHPIDRFVYDRLRKNGLTPSKRADLPTLVRRASFDLLGLPPTFDEVRHIETSPDHDAWQRLVDRYLSMDEYGERWGRHWLDVARYADTKGYVFTEEARFPYAYTYRDYVIEAFNADLPFDQFIIEQIAADKLDTTENKKALAAMGFLTVGDRFRNKQNEIIDDRIDVVTRGFMGLTVSCARCHDHKYDPIPTKDYYSLYGVFASSQEVDELPVIGHVPDDKAHQVFLAELAKREKAIDDKMAQITNDIKTQVIEQLELYLEEIIVGKNHKGAVLRKHMVTLLRTAIETPPKALKPVLYPLHQLHQLSDESVDTYAIDAKQIINKLHRGNVKINDHVLTALTRRPIVNSRDVTAIYSDLFAKASKRWQQQLQTDPNATQLADAQWEEIRQVLYSPLGPIGRSDDDIARAFGQSEREALRALKNQIPALMASSDGAPPRAMVMRDKKTLYNPRVFLRGSDKNQGAAVPRQFIKLLAGDNRKPFSATSSGRLELA
ncbi:MAG: DUF1549 domain-containing protein, partial [Planctomycetes bacterium]|nr:DUF1549 domain-containing protein [Planctomycetota bacterium]